MNSGVRLKSQTLENYKLTFDMKISQQAQWTVESETLEQLILQLYALDKILITNVSAVLAM